MDAYSMTAASAMRVVPSTDVPKQPPSDSFFGSTYHTSYNVSKGAPEQAQRVVERPSTIRSVMQQPNTAPKTLESTTKSVYIRPSAQADAKLHAAKPPTPSTAEKQAEVRKMQEIVPTRIKIFSSAPSGGRK
jgi:hypothetical protein